MKNEFIDPLLEELVKRITPLLQNEVSKAISQSFSIHLSSLNNINLSRKEAAQYLGYTTTTLYNWDKNGTLTAVRIGRKCIYPKVKLDAFLNVLQVGDKFVHSI